MPAPQPRQIPRFDTLTTLVRDEEGHGFSFGDFALNVRNQPSRTRLHRHDYMELFFFHRGAGSHLNDFHNYAVGAPALVFVEAGHVHAWPDAMNLRGDMVSFDAGFVQPAVVAGQTAVFFMPPSPVVIPLTKAEAATAVQGFGRIRAEWEERCPGWMRVVRATMQILHEDATRAWSRQESGATVPDNAATRLAREFLLMMEHHVRADVRPGILAAALKVSADHLAATLRTVTGKTTQQHLHVRLLLEARRLLAHSRLDVAEIAWHLGFKSSSYFGRFFSRQLGVSPGQFRKRVSGGMEG